MQHLGLVVITLLVIGLAITIVKRPASLNKTFSQRVANSKRAEMYYALLFVCTLPLLYVFFAHWLVPERGISQNFLWFAAVAVLFQIACMFVPERGGVYTIVHRILAAISGIALLPMVAIIATTQSVFGLLQQLVWILFIMMATLLVVALLNQKGFKYALLLQSGYYILFFVAILAVTYV